MSSNHSIGSMNQLADALDNAGFTSEDVTKLKQFGNLKAIKDLFYGRADIVMTKILELLGTVIIPATTEKFVVRDYISKLRKKRKVYTGSNFENWFFNKTVEPISKSELRYHKLRKNSVDDLIIAELGSEAKAETTLAEMFALMQMQPNGESGILLTNGYANIFYVRDINSVLRVVYCYWCDVVWIVSAYPVGYPGAWFDGRQVFSRNSCES